VPKKERYGLIYAIFWTALAVSLAISLYVGLNSTFIWYMERQSYKMYETMLIGAAILLVFVIVVGQVRVKRLLNRENALKSRLAITSDGGNDDIVAEELVGEIEGLNTRRGGSWLLLSPLILMAIVFLIFSAISFVLLSPYLVENHQINAVFILFAGSISKIAIGLESVVLFRYMIS
jgi:hypothetical protein